MKSNYKNVKRHLRIPYHAFSILALTLFSSVSFSQVPAWAWGKSINGQTNDYGNAVAVDASGNVYTTGGFNGVTTDFDPGPGVFTLFAYGADDIFVSKLDASGDFVWAVAIGAIALDNGYSIAVDAASNVYVTGYFSGTVDFDPNNAAVFNLTTNANSSGIFVLKLNSSGNFVWAKAMDGSGNDRGHSLVLDASANVYITGTFSGTVDFDPGPGVFNLTGIGNGMFVSKLDASGNFIWAKALGGVGQSIALDASGNILTTGVFQSTADFDPDAGTFNLTAAGNYDAFVSKLDNAGNFLWAKAMGGTSLEQPYSIAADAAGNVYSCGLFWFTADFDPGAAVFNITSPGGPDVYVSKLNSSGDFVWAKTMGGTGYDEGRSLTLDAQGNVYIAGYFNATADFDPNAGIFNINSNGGDDIFLCKLDNAGNLGWAKQAGDSLNDVANSVALSAAGNLHIAGYFFSLDLTITSLLQNADTSASTEDIFIAKTDIITVTDEIENHNDGNFVLFPNPASSELIIDNGKWKIEQVEIYNSIGEKVFPPPLSPLSFRRGVGGEVKLNVSSFSQGIYFVRIKTSEGIRTTKFVKE